VINAILELIKEFATGVIGATGYPGIIMLMCLESACIPVPSEVIMPFAGFLAYEGVLNVHWAAAAGALGCMLGSALAYWVGIRGGRPFLAKYGKYVLAGQHEIEMADRWFNRYGQWAVFASRMLPIIRTFISLPAGIHRMGFLPFIVLSFVGSLPWCYALAYVGYHLGKNWLEVKYFLHRFDAVILVGLALLLAVVVYRRFVAPGLRARADAKKGSGSERRAKPATPKEGR
jgi:membrane protein DedA with SNARE-associated domain